MDCAGLRRKKAAIPATAGTRYFRAATFLTGPAAERI
jgi:hypothetical protein